MAITKITIQLPKFTPEERFDQNLVARFRKQTNNHKAENYWSYYLVAFASTDLHMGQIPQDGNFGQNVSLF